MEGPNILKPLHTVDISLNPLIDPKLPKTIQVPERSLNPLSDRVPCAMLFRCPARDHHRSLCCPPDHPGCQLLGQGLFDSYKANDRA